MFLLKKFLGHNFLKCSWTPNFWHKIVAPYFFYPTFLEPNIFVDLNLLDIPLKTQDSTKSVDLNDPIEVVTELPKVNNQQKLYNHICYYSS